MASANDNRDADDASHTQALSRRALLQGIVGASVALTLPSELLANLNRNPGTISPEVRFPYFESAPVPYFSVQLQDEFWAPRQRTVHAIGVPWATRHYDEAGGVDVYRAQPKGYVPKVKKGDLEAIKFVESLATVVGLQRDSGIEGLADAWGREMIASQDADGYFAFGWPLANEPARRWQNIWWSEEDYALGHYLEAAMALRESTGNTSLYESAVRAIDNMASTFLGSHRAHCSADPEIEQALMRLFGATGNPRYVELCGWLIGQRGHPKGRQSFGMYGQDHLPVEQQRTIEGHAVRAAFLYNGVTEYVGATGHPGYRDAVLCIWDDFVSHKMYLHGAGGITSLQNEGYSPKPDYIPPGDCYGESCSVVGNFVWAHNLFRLTGDASHIDVAERMLYNAFYASLSLQGDRYFYENVAQQDRPTARFAWHPVPCCPPNIVKLFAKVGGFFYSTDKHGVFVKHYGSSEAEIPFGQGVRFIQRTDFPWDGRIVLHIEPAESTQFVLRLRIPAWAEGYTVQVNSNPVPGSVERGWLSILRTWKRGDKVELNLPMPIQRVTMPARFKEYQNLAALQRGPVVYCLEEQDLPREMRSAFGAYLPEIHHFTAEYRPELLGGVTILRGNLILPSWTGEAEKPVAVTFIPYGVWDNRSPGAMRIWLPARKLSLEELVPTDPPGTQPESKT